MAYSHDSISNCNASYDKTTHCLYVLYVERWNILYIYHCDMLINTRMLANITCYVDLILALHLILIVFCRNEPYKDPLNEVDLFTVVMIMNYCHMWKLFMLDSSQILQILHFDEKNIFTQPPNCCNEIKQWCSLEWYFFCNINICWGCAFTWRETYLLDSLHCSLVLALFNISVIW